MHCMRRGSQPPYPPLRKGGKVGGVRSFFSQLAKGGHRGGFFECLCDAPGLASRRLKIALGPLKTLCAVAVTCTSNR